ncbi:MAG: hypothetical protein IH941_08585 [Acidobacteria bacterium]|nr:hypothetical protein [Acidobacteriota bacterium]
MGIELSRMIAEVVAAAGRGAESLRLTGTPVVLEECSIEVVLDDDPAPSAHVRVSFGRQAETGQSP